MESNGVAFGATSTADQVLQCVDLHTTTAVVTGASGGIGLETARALAARGAAVVIAGRDSAKLDAALEFIRGSHRGAAVEAMRLDLTSLDSVRAFARQYLEGHKTLNLLINNAGVMCTPLGRTSDGFETQFGTNHLGHFLLTNLLSPALVAADSARIVNLSSAGHRLSDIDFDDPNFEHRAYDPWVAYGQSKTANILCALSLDTRLRDHDVRAFSVHPGGIRTDLGRYMTSDDIAVMMARMKESDDGSGRGGFQWKTIPQGAATSVWAATSPTLNGLGGLYCEDCSVAGPVTNESGTSAGCQPYALDADSAARLWVLSERLVRDPDR